MQTLKKLISDIIKYKLDAGGIGDIQSKFIHANGCGSKGGYKFPSSFLGVYIESACSLHDMMWELAESYSDLVEANEIFDNNLKRISDAESIVVMRWIRRQMISYYISGVELIGTPTEARNRNFKKKGRSDIDYIKSLQTKYFTLLQ